MCASHRNTSPNASTVRCCFRFPVSTQARCRSAIVRSCFIVVPANAPRWPWRNALRPACRSLRTSRAASWRGSMHAIRPSHSIRAPARWWTANSARPEKRNKADTMVSLVETDRAAPFRPIAFVLAGLVLWVVLYSQLDWFSHFVVSGLAVPPGTRMHEAIAFFAYDIPKVLLLLTLVVFAMGVVRSFFSPERTRRLLAG